MKKRIAAAALIVLILALFAYGTTAFINAEGRATNVITTGTIEMSLTEEGDGTPIEGGMKFENVMPGQTLAKKPVVENTGTQDFYLRVRIDKSFENTELDSAVMALDGPGDGWTEEGGWYYYNSIVKPGDKVTVFSTVSFDARMGNEYQSAAATIAVTAQAVQAKNNAPASGNVTDVVGWPELPQT
ncbi:MAG: TasA family protein [Candidatus Heteroscillospira sp.]